jgi:small subunit ribosomal protein S18
MITKSTARTTRNTKKPTRQTQRVSQAARKKQSKSQVVFFDYRDERKLKRFINEQGKIIPRRITGLSAKEQRLLTRSIKWARHLAIIAFVSDQIR